MIEIFVTTWEKNKHLLEQKFKEKHPEDYLEIVTKVTEILQDAGLDPCRVTQIDHGDYQGTLLYVIGAIGYQPREYYFVKVGYGSCSGCDTLKSIRSYEDDPPNEKQVKDYMTLALHIVQGLKELSGEAIYD